MRRPIVRRVMLGIIVLVMLPVLGWWWTGPRYDPRRFKITESALDDVPIGKANLELQTRKPYTFTCKVQTTGELFLLIPPGTTIETASILNQSACDRSSAEGKQIPSFLVSFTQFWRAGRGVPGESQFADVVRIDEAAREATLRVVFVAPSKAGTYSLKLELISCSDVNWGPNGSGGFKPGTVVWHHPVVVRSN